MPSMNCDSPRADEGSTGIKRTQCGLFALVDCDNFYVSCERVFNPRLRNRPVVALSNNDGCIISRSREAKKLGIKMGAPLHHVTADLKRHNIAVLSSNYALYGDMSARVLRTLHEFTPDIEVYSIDEAFLRLGARPRLSFNDLAERIRDTVERWTGVPVSIGLGQTKTLAKVAVEVAKENSGVFNIAACPDPEETLRKTPVGDIWGIGKRYRIWLESLGIDTALALRDLDDDIIKRRAGIVGLRTVWELRGRPCLPLSALVPARKGITASRSFGRPVSDYKLLREAVASYGARAGAKLRRDGSVAGFLTVFLMTNRFSDDPQYSKSAVVPLVPATDSDCDLIRAATGGLRRIYRPDFVFHKAGVILTGITPAAQAQTDLFAPRSKRFSGRLNRTLDKINRENGSGTLRYAATGLQRLWRMRSNRRSPRYTTRWDEIPTAYAR